MQNEIFFNELCLKDKIDDYSVVKNLVDCYKKLKSESFSVCRIDENFKQDLLNYLKSIKGINQKDILGFIYSFFHSPYERKTMTDDDEYKFITHDLYFDNNKANGFLWAHIYDTFAFRLLTNEKWNSDFILTEDRTNGQSVSIHHVATSENVNNQKEWIESLKEISLQSSSILPENKKFHVRDDHGVDVLKDFWNKIKKCEYVEACINSIPFNSHDRKLIKTVKPNGEIELVLYWTDKGLGICIKTTGRNFRETQRIAEILETKYSE